MVASLAGGRVGVAAVLGEGTYTKETLIIFSRVVNYKIINSFLHSGAERGGGRTLDDAEHGPQ